MSVGEIQREESEMFIGALETEKSGRRKTTPKETKQEKRLTEVGYSK